MIKYAALLLLTACTHQQTDFYVEIIQSPTIDDKLIKLTDDMQRLRRDFEIR